MSPLIIYENYHCALENAVLYHRTDIISFFLSIIPKKTTKQVADAFGIAARYGKADIVGIFLDWGIELEKLSDFEIYPLLETTDYNLLRMLLEKGVNVNNCDKYGTSALLKIVTEDKIENSLRLSIVKLLLEYGADPNVIDKNGRLIDQAIKAGHKEIIQTLYQAGAEE